MQSVPDENKKQKDIRNNENLTTYIIFLEKKISVLEVKQQENNIEILRIKQNIKSLEEEINHLKEPPLITGIITDILDLEKNRVIVSSSTGPSFIVNMSSKIKDSKIIPGMMVALTQQTMAAIEILPSNIDPFVQAMEIIERINEVSYSDIGGLDDQIQEVRETVELPLTCPSLFKKVGIEPPNGVLLYGPPGTGKTLIAKAVAHGTNATFIRIIGSELVQKFIGEGARYVREIFNLAKKKAPTILFIDELDAIGAERMDDATMGDREVHRTLMQLMAELDGFNKRENVRIIGATNRVDILDSALLRPGRFDRIVNLPIPNEKAREKIFKIHMRNLAIEKEIDIKQIIKMTEGATGAHIKAICTEAGMFAIRNDQDFITEEQFISAVAKILNKQRDNCPPSRIFI